LNCRDYSRIVRLMVVEDAYINAQLRLNVSELIYRALIVAFGYFPMTKEQEDKI